jgi:hypothetical protein
LVGYFNYNNIIISNTKENQTVLYFTAIIISS